MHVAQPVPRDRQGRPPVIPASLAAQRVRRGAGEKKRTEKDVEVRAHTLCAVLIGTQASFGWNLTLVRREVRRPCSHRFDGVDRSRGASQRAAALQESCV